MIVPSIIIVSIAFQIGTYHLNLRIISSNFFLLSVVGVQICNLTQQIIIRLFARWFMQGSNSLATQLEESWVFIPVSVCVHYMHIVC